LTAPPDYIFEPIAETLLLNVYGFENPPSKAVIVDVGASIGDFTLLASRSPQNRVYAYEPSIKAFRYMRFNLVANKRTILAFNRAANASVLDSILEKYAEPSIDFLKVDCEGCEYELLLECSATTLSKIKKIAMEIHSIPEWKRCDLVQRLKNTGFSVKAKIVGRGSYLYASINQ